MNNYKFTQFNSKDLSSISDQLESCYDNFWNYNILKNELNNSNSFYLCLKDNKEIVGFAGITIVLDTAELNNIVIKKSQRGNGCSIILLEEMIKLAKNKNCKVMQLEVSATNKIAIHLYEKLGFKKVGLRAGYYNGTDALLMTLYL